MVKVFVPRSDVTPESTTKEGLQAQINEQVAVLYSQEATVEEKEVAALNYRRLVNYYVALFQVLPQ